MKEADASFVCRSIKPPEIAKPPRGHRASPAVRVRAVTLERRERRSVPCGSGAEVMKSYKHGRYEEFPTLNTGYTVEIHSIHGYFLDTLINFHLFMYYIEYPVH